MLCSQETSDNMIHGNNACYLFVRLFMNAARIFAIFLLFFLFFVCAPSADCFADSVSVEVRTQIKALRASIKELKRLARGSTARKIIASSSSSGLLDSDSDGIPDIFEQVLKSNSCQTDSDDDGISDGDEGKSGSKPDDSTSGEVELTGLITALTSSTVTVNGNTFTASESTQYLKGATSLSSFQVGDLVELKGKIRSGVLELIKIKKED